MGAATIFQNTGRVNNYLGTKRLKTTKTKRMKSRLALLAIAAGLAAGGFGNDRNCINPKDIDVTPKEPPVPKGCERYYYNKAGICCKSESEVYFDATKPSKAYEKYKRWLLINKM